jgi:TRAP-type uncharacterized transport system substrate-binding protein
MLSRRWIAFSHVIYLRLLFSDGSICFDRRRRANAAFCRSDIAIPQNGSTVVILHNDIAVLAAPAGSTIIKVTGLFKKRVGIFPATTSNAALLDAILAEYEIAPATVQHIMLSGDDLATIVSQKGVDAILTVGPLRGRSIEIATAALASRNRAPVLITVDAAEGMAARGPEYQKADIPAGFFRGSPPQPKEDVATISIGFGWRRVRTSRRKL